MAGGVDCVQLRDRELEGAALLAWAREISAAARRAADARRRVVTIVVNRRVDVALALGADGVHLGFDAMSACDARDLLERFAGPSPSVGCSAHSVDDVKAAAASGATYVHLAPIWRPKSKPATRPALGTGPLATACALGIPVLAQGGVTRARCRAALEAGSAGVAVTGEILLAEDPRDAAAALRAALDGER